jgi:hypothetical protein
MPCYYYVSKLFVYLLNVLWLKIQKYEILLVITRIIAELSYEIFFTNGSNLFIQI